VLAFQNANLMNIAGASFAGLTNFERLMHDPVFWGALWTTVVYVVTSVVAGLVLGTGLALV